MKIFMWAMWLTSGVFLFYKGVQTLTLLHKNSYIPVLILFAAYIVGELKARYVLSKSIQRNPNLMDVVIIGVMAASGIVLGKIDYNLYLKLFIQLAVGFALLRGSSFRLRNLLSSYVIKS
jgi:flagellar biosynthesis protein FliP